MIIIGCPGTGKTTFAFQLARLTRLPLEHLDYHYYDERFDFAANRPAWRDHVAGMVAADRWIIEGNYKSTFDIRMPRADTIIFFDYPRRVAMWRALKRRVMYHRTLRPDMPPTWKEHISTGLAKTIWQFNARNRPAIHELLAAQPPHKMVVVFKRPADAQAYLANAVKAKPSL